MVLIFYGCCCKLEAVPLGRVLGVLDPVRRQLDLATDILAMAPPTPNELKRAQEGEPGQSTGPINVTSGSPRAE